MQTREQAEHKYWMPTQEMKRIHKQTGNGGMQTEQGMKDVEDENNTIQS